MLASFTSTLKVAVCGVSGVPAIVAVLEALPRFRLWGKLPELTFQTRGGTPPVDWMVWLYGKATRQFSAFHICLERTHRYLLAYKISEKIESGRDRALENIACIMANASMITRQDIDAQPGDGVSPGRPKINAGSPIAAVIANGSAG